MKSKKGKKVPLQVYLPPDLFQALKEKSEELGITMSDLVREILAGALRYGILLPGEKPPEVKAKLDMEELEALIQKIIEEYEARRKKKSIWKRLFWR